MERAVTLRWEPIESAPKDGTVVLLWARDFGFPKEACRVTMGEWRPPSGITTAMNGEVHTGWVSIEGELDGHPEEGDFLVQTMIMPTHWMPLPAPPQAAKE